jgi:N-acetyl-anhydromuramyl-L-alanine amidase AmpD
MSPSWGYFSENNSAKYSKQANFLTTTLMAQAKDKNIVVGFTNEWNPASAYRVNGSSSTISRYRDSFPYACFSGVDFAVAQLLSTDGNSARYTNTDGSVEILSEEGQYARETTATFSQGIQDYINYGFSNIIPALGAIGEKYHDYGYDSRKPPERIKEEIGFLVSGSTEGFGAQAPDKSNDYGLFELASVEESVMWWDWASANDTSPCWDSDRWTTIKEFNSFGLASDLAAAEGGAGTNTRTSAASTAEYSSAMKGIDMFKRLAVRNEWLTESQAASISPQILRAPALSILGVSSVSELSALAQSAAATLKSSATELGIDHGDFTTDVLAPTDTGLPSWMSDPPDLGVVTGSPSREEIEEWDLGPMSPDGTYAMLALPDYINYDSPADPWQYKGGWCPVHGYVTGTGMTAASRTPDDIFYIMLHTTAGSGQSAGFGWFQDPTCGASTHYGVNTGGYVYQGVREKDIAWHAGEKSSSRPGSPGEDKYSGRNNSNGIGIEIAGIIPDEKAQPGRFYSEEMYEGLAYLCASIASRNGISIDREHIIGHDEVRKDKIDPGSDLDDQERSYDLRSDHGHYEYESVFDYRKLFTMINEYLAGAGVPIPLSTGFPSGAPPSAAAAGQGGVDAGGCEAASAAGASVVGGVNPTTIMPLSEVPDNTPAASASSGAFLESSTAPPGVITLFGVSARSLVAADLSSLPDGPNLTFDYTPDPTNFGKESPTKIIDQLPIATDLAHYLYAMIKAAEGDGIPLSLNSVWRNNPDIAAGGSGSGTWKSSKGQQTLYDANCSSGTCSPSTARPGTSRHQLGVAVDIAGTTPVGSAIFEWLSKNAEAFGFYRSVSSERWHWVLDPAKNKYARVASDHASWTN